MDRTEIFEAERPRLISIASRVLGERAEAEDIVQQAWLRLERALARDETAIDHLPAWLTTVTTRLCLDRLRSRTPVPVEEVELAGTAPDPAEDVALADTVGIALQAVIDRLTPRERVAFVLHDSFGFEFATIAAVLDTTPAAARKLASRARSKVAQPVAEDALADWEVVDAFMAAARGGDVERLLQLLAPDAVVAADESAILAGTPAVDRGTGRGRGLLQRQRPLRARGVRRGATRVSLVPARRGEGRLRLHRRSWPGHGHHLPRSTHRARPGRTSIRRPADVTPVSTTPPGTAPPRWHDPCHPAPSQHPGGENT